MKNKTRNMKRRINKVAVLGSGVMGSRIACHFANVGLDVLLLDIVPRELNEVEKSKGKTLEDVSVRNRIVNDALQFAIKSNPSPLYRKSDSSKIKTGNLDLYRIFNEFKVNSNYPLIQYQTSDGRIKPSVCAQGKNTDDLAIINASRAISTASDPATAIQDLVT